MIARRNVLINTVTRHLSKLGPFEIARIMTLVVAILTSCDMAPVKPEEVFILYRERMNHQNVNLYETRKLLSQDSLSLVTQIEQKHKLNQPPENIALLNILDPITPPGVVKVDESPAILQVRTLKGENRLIRLVRSEQNAPWKVDITEELKSLLAFLDAREALNALQQQAGEFAASWRDLENQLERLGGPESESRIKDEGKDEVPKTGKPKTSPKPLKKEEKARSK